MPFGKGTVFVLGAGFTRGFYGNAPLLVDNYDVLSLLGPSTGILSGITQRIVKAELDRRTDGKVNLESLMTRLSGRMPYDRKHGIEAELPLLLARIEDLFLKRIESAIGPALATPSMLQRFARHCIREETTCITFNYDDALDRVLYAESQPRPGSPQWNPDRGYGFPCRPSETALHTDIRLKAPTAMRLLKLHGSINWHATLGHPRPYEVSAIVHHAEWATTGRPSMYITEAQQYLEPRPFIVPPVLTKAELVEHPILAVLWSQAFAALHVAQQLVFIGYSLPMTDVGGGFLFRETWEGITVVDHAQTGREDEKRKDLWKSYNEVFRGFQESRIELCGGVKWIEDHIP
jgi:hypothetical protein